MKQLTGNLADRLGLRAETIGERLAYVFLDGDGEPAEFLSYRELDRRARGLAGALQSRLPPRTPVALLCEDALPFVTRFWGCLYAGMVPVPLPAPRFPRDSASLGRLRAVVAAAELRHVLGDQAHRERAEEGLRATAELRWLSCEELMARPESFRPAPAAADDEAFIQFTSGSTSAPRGARISHANVLRNIDFILRTFAYDQLTVLSWLPLFHDMGLVGHVLGPVVGGGVSVLLPNAAFLRDPLLWLRSISRFGIAISGAPPFAYEACVRRFAAAPRRFELACWKTAYVGAEPVARATLRRFAETFAGSAFDPGGFLPCYGLAEATLLVAGARLAATGETVAGEEPLAYRIAPDDAAIAIVDPASGAELAPGEMGEIVVRGPSVALGYAGLAGDPTDSFFIAPGPDGRRAVRTGDLGWLDGDRLHLAGRRKDVVIVRGTNHFSEDLEAAVAAAHPRLYGQAGAAFARPGAPGAGEELVLLQELEVRREAPPWDEMASAALAALAAHGLTPALLVFVRRGLLPRTTSGKVSRAGSRELFAAGGLGELARWQDGVVAVPRGRAVAEPEKGERDRENDLAIVGMACRFPGGADHPEAFWRLLESGEDAIGEVPPERWSLEDHYDSRPAIPGKMNTRHGGFITGVDLFDAELFGISGVEARDLDPQQRLLLETAWRAFENAGIPLAELAGASVGVFIGISTNDYLHLQIRTSSTLEHFNAYSGLGNSHSIGANRLSYVFDLRGPSLAVDTACSSSLTALHLAAESLRRGECTLAIAGGVNLMLSPGTTILLSQFSMMAPGGRCRAFDAGADGYVRSEGCGLLVLKPLRQARRDGDRILAAWCGSAMNQDGRSPGITAPRGEAQRRVIADALRRARLPATAVSLIEAHGTGTPVGDPVEAEELVAVYGRPAGVGSCHLGSVKASVGHLEAAAGVASVIKTVLALRHRRIPPQLHLAKLNPKIDLAGSGLEIATTARDWAVAAGRDGVTRHAAVSSFGFGGANVHALLREAAPDENPPPAGAGGAGGPWLFPLSARSPAALARLAADWAELLERRPDLPLAALVSAQTFHRSHFPYRAASVVTSLEDLRAKLAEGVEGRAWRRGRAPEAATPNRLAFLFPGQGETWPGMGRELHATLPVFRQAFDRCAAAFPGGRLAELALAAEELVAEAVQPALFAVSYALAETFRSWGIAARAFCGHSLGEYVAATLAGALTPENAMQLVAERSRLTTGIPARGAMAAVLAPLDQVRAVAERHGLDIAAVNLPENVVISGPAEALRAAFAELPGPGRRLATAQAFHSALLDPLLDSFAGFAQGIPAARPELAWVSTLDGAFVSSPPDARHWRRQLREPVRWMEGFRRLHETGCRVFVEIGPGQTLTGFGRRLAPDGLSIATLAGSPNGELADLLDALARLYVAGLPVNFAAVTEKLPFVDEIPGHPFDRRRYWYDQVEARAPEPARAATVFEPRWQLTPLREATAEPAGPAAEGAAEKVGWILIESGEADAREQALGAAIAARIAELDGETFRIFRRPGAAAGFRKLGRDRRRQEWRFEMTADGDAADRYESLTAIVTRESRAGTTRWRVLYLGGLAATAALSAASLRRDHELHGVGDLTEWVKALVQTALYLPLWILTRGAEPVTSPPSHPLALAQAPLWGFAKTLFLEHPEMRGGLVDLDPEGAPEMDAALVCRQILAGGREDHVAFRGGERFSARLVPLPPAPSPAAPRLRHEGIHVITGGLGGLGLACARWLAEHGSRRLALIGPRLPPPRASWDALPADAASAERVRAIQAIEALGCRVDLYQADVADRPQLAAAFAAIAAAGPVRGVLHAAGVNWFGRILGVDKARLLATMPIKADAAWHLHQLTAAEDLDFFVLFSSVSSLWGSVGLSHYSAANRFLDALAAERRRLGLPAVSIAWGPWAEVGMSAKEHEREILGQLGFQLFQPREALARLGELLMDGPPLAAVARIDWRAFEPFMAFSASPSLFDEVREGRSGLLGDDGPVELARLRSLPVAAAGQELQALVIGQLASVLHGGITGELDLEQRFNMMGMDSLTAIAFAARLENALGLPIPSALAYNHPTVAAVTASLLERIHPEAAAVQSEAPAGSPGESHE